jgi:hypothetical protein
MNQEELKEYLKENLTIEVDEECYGFNGVHLVIRLELEDEVLSERYVDIKNDEG